jgi:hypothetical protein
MRVSVDVMSAGRGPREPQGWDYPEAHKALRDGRVLQYWVKAQSLAWPGDGVAVIIRRAG